MDCVPHTFIEHVTNTLFASARNELISATLGQWSSIPAVFTEYRIYMQLHSESGEIRYGIFLRIKEIKLSELLSSWNAHKCAIVSLSTKVWCPIVEAESSVMHRMHPGDVKHIAALIASGRRRMESVDFDSKDLMKVPDIWPILDAISAVGDIEYNSGGSLCVSHFMRWRNTASPEFGLDSSELVRRILFAGNSREL